jgi:AraC-like DNA-binding protein
MHQLLYAFDGAVEVEGSGGRYKVPHQYAVWVPAGAVHRTTLQKVGSGSVFLSTDMVACAHDAPRVIAAPPILREMVMYAMRWPLDRAEDPTSEVYFQCLAQLCQGWIRDEVKLVLPFSTDERITAIMDFTRDHIGSVTLSQVCRQAGMSERTLRRRFREGAGLTWEEYRLRLRMCVALDALGQTADPVGVIAVQVGYTDSAAFARAFRSLVGISPGEYRNRGGR